KKRLVVHIFNWTICKLNNVRKFKYQIQNILLCDFQLVAVRVNLGFSAEFANQKPIPTDSRTAFSVL
ncbi:MAG: hypothetical protein ACJAZY_002863, partial [Spirosomataceae bacterium]